MKKFWNWKSRTVTNQETMEQTEERTLFRNGTIAEDSWYDNDVTLQLFKDELIGGSGNITDPDREIARLKQQEALDAEMSKPTAAPLTGKPLSGAKTGRVSKA